MQLTSGNFFIGNLISRINGTNNLFRFTGRLYLTDLFDIIIITLFIYSLFLLFRKTRSFVILIGLFIIAVLYVVAKTFNLYLTSMALQYFFGVSVVMFVIIFQQEIRKYIEMIGLIGTRQIKVKSIADKSPTINEIIQSCVKMARDRIGALIVVRGIDNLDPLIEGGVPVDGLVSEELLLSIFDPHSEGHDGAVIVENNRISKLGTHLPLSNNFKEIDRHGTRHSAALGLSENTDAFCIVVSEEKGTISVCRSGRIKTLEDFSDLEKELSKFIREKFPTPSGNLFLQFITRNPGLKSVALISAAVLWFFSAYRAGIVSKTFVVPVSFKDLPGNVFIEDYSPKNVTVVASGRGDISFNNVNLSDFKVTVDAAGIKDGVNKINLNRSNVSEPLNLSTDTVEPADILLTAKKYSSVMLPVTVKTVNQPAKNYHVAGITVTPEKVGLLVPDDISAPAQIFTDNIDLKNLRDSFVTEASLILPPGIRLDNPATATVSAAVTIEKI